jgi:ferredoxin
MSAHKLPPFYLRLRFATAAIATWLMNLGMFSSRLQLKSACAPGFNCHGCPWATFACPVGAIAYGSAMHAIPVFAIASVLAIGALLGRLVCSFACPMGLLQDLLHRIPSPKIHLPRWFRYGKYVTLALLVVLLPWALGFVPSGYLKVDKPLPDKSDTGLSVKVKVTNLGTEPVVGPELTVVYRAVADKSELSRETKRFPQVIVAPGQAVDLPAFEIVNRLSEANLIVDSPQSEIRQGAPWHLYYCDLCPTGTLTAAIPAMFKPGISTSLYERVGGRALRLAILAGFLVLMVIASRPLCRLFCPLGAMYALCAPVSLAGMKIDSAACIQCGKCDKVCPMDLDVRQEVGGRECIVCGDCKKVCPGQGIQRTFTLLPAGSPGSQRPVPFSSAGRPHA